ncbi:MAG: gliding motility-associated ABC transporter substrate-binding protein GldG [Sphingomonadales bacterium]|nr:gliding motility-associated ABC transporter substrate-binding protein GldG [Sphingomonadales bacterium]
MKRSLYLFYSKWYGVPIAILVFVLTNALASFIPFRFDLTKEKRYTVSKATSQLLDQLEAPLEVTVFLKGSFPSGFRKLQASTDQLLSLFKQLDPAHVQYQFLSPAALAPDGKPWSDSLMRLGALNINLTVQKEEGQSSNIIFPVALVTYQGRSQLVTLFPGASRSITQTELNTAEALLEYQFVSAIEKLIHTDKPGIAYETGHGEPVDERTYQLRVALEDNYELRSLDLTRQPLVPNEVDLLLLVKPALAFSEQDKFKIDQFVMRGGKLLCFIDNLYAEMDSFARRPDMVAFERGLQLEDLFFRYGARINTDLLMDLRCEFTYMQVGGTPDRPQNEFLPWNYFPLLSAAESKLHTPGYIGTRFVHSIDTIAVPGIKKYPVLISSERARTISTPALVSLNENSIVPDNEKFNRAGIPAAVLLEGSFPSLFKNRASLAQLDAWKSVGQSFRSQSENTAMILVADGDLVLNEYIPLFDQSGQPDPRGGVEPIQMGWNKYTLLEAMNQGPAANYFLPVANRDFLLNAVEYLVSDPALAQVRSKELVLRLLDGPQVKEQKFRWQLICIGLPLLLLSLGGLLYQTWRKRAYTR